MRSNLTLMAAGVALSLLSLPVLSAATPPITKKLDAKKHVAHWTNSKWHHTKGRRHSKWAWRRTHTKIVAMMHTNSAPNFGGYEALPPADTQGTTPQAEPVAKPVTSAPVTVAARHADAPVWVAPPHTAVPSPAPQHSGFSTLPPSLRIASITHSVTTSSSAPSAIATSKVIKVSLEFVNTDIVQILRALAMQTNVNIVASPEVKGTLTVSLNDIDVEEALKMVTGMTNLAYARIGETVLVAPKDRIDIIRRAVTGEAPAAPEDMVSDAYVVKGGKASELVEAIAGKGTSTVGQVALLATPETSPSRQAIVLHGPQSQVAMVRRTLEQLDVPSEGVVEGYEIYQVKHLDPRALREDLIAAFPGLRSTVLPGQVSSPGIYKPSEIAKEGQTSLTDTTQKQGGQGGSPSANGGAAGGGGTATDVKSAEDNRGTRDTMGLTQPFQDYEKVAVPMTLVLRGRRSLIDQALTYLDKIDIAPKQVALELRVMELTKDDATRVGLDWSLLSGMGTVQTIRSNQGLGDTAATPGTISGTFTGPLSVTATLDKAVTKNNLIARPNLLAVDGRSAEVFVGDVIRYIQTIQSSQNGTSVQTGEEHVGVRLAILPRVGADGTIVMELRPIVTYLTGFTPVPGGGELPQTSERVEQTTAIIKDGDTIALGGLIQDQDKNTVSGIPILKDLPLVGELFRRTTKDRNRSEIVFFLTARIVDPHKENTAADPRNDHPVPPDPEEKLHHRG